MPPPPSRSLQRDRERTVEFVHVPSKRVLRELPVRVATFLAALSGEPSLCATLEKGGYGPKHHRDGMRLLSEACSYPKGAIDPDVDRPARDAASELHAWMSLHLARFKAILERFHPASLALLAGLDASDGSEAVLAAATLLRRLTELEDEEMNGPVLVTLSERGFDRAERARLQELVASAQRATLPEGALQVAFSAKRGGKDKRATDAAQLALYRWFVDWSTTAKSFVKRKDWLIRLGLSQRRSKPDSADGVAP